MNAYGAGQDRVHTAMMSPMARATTADPSPPTAVVFGARPGGMGASLAMELASRGGLAGIALVARTRESVEATAAALEREHRGLAVLPLVADLANPRAVDEVVAALRRERVPGGGTFLEGLHRIVFAAGTVVSDEGAPDRIRRMHAIKARVAPELIRRLGKSLERNASAGTPSIILVGSITALIPVPSLSEYGESNARLLELGEDLEALRRRGIHCTYCAPAYVRNGSLRSQLEDDVPNPLARQWVWWAADPARDVARETLAASAAGDRLVIPGRTGRALYRQYRLARSFGVTPLFRLVQQVGARWSGFQ